MLKIKVWSGSWRSMYGNEMVPDFFVKSIRRRRQLQVKISWKYIITKIDFTKYLFFPHFTALQNNAENEKLLWPEKYFVKSNVVKTLFSRNFCQSTAQKSKDHKKVFAIFSSNHFHGKASKPLSSSFIQIVGFTEKC